MQYDEVSSLLASGEIRCRLKVPHVQHIVATMEAKGDDLVHQAEQALKKWSLFSGGDKFEDAADKYQRAGNAYKASKACA